MPQPALHLSLGLDLLEGWQSAGHRAPFQLAPDTANAFLHGTLGPDIGYFPGADHELSHLLHHGPTGGMVRALVAHAADERQRAYGFGWLSHVLADALLHPLVNRVAATRLGPSLNAHIRVEVGIDVGVARHDVRLRSLRVRSAFGAQALAFQASALHDAYGILPTQAALLQMHDTVTRFLRPCLLFATTYASGLCWADAPGTGLPQAAWWLATRLCRPGSNTSAYLNPLQPAAAVLDTVQRSRARICGEVQYHADTRLRELPDYDLEDGTVWQAAVA